ncbi:MAG: hypothetical protein WCF01_10965 [Nitrososphaeraceae archaeon]
MSLISRVVPWREGDHSTNLKENLYPCPNGTPVNELHRQNFYNEASITA